MKLFFLKRRLLDQRKEKARWIKLLYIYIKEIQSSNKDIPWLILVSLQENPAPTSLTLVKKEVRMGKLAEMVMVVQLVNACLCYKPHLHPTSRPMYLYCKSRLDDISKSMSSNKGKREEMERDREKRWWERERWRERYREKRWRETERRVGGRWIATSPGESPRGGVGEQGVGGGRRSAIKRKSVGSTDYIGDWRKSHKQIAGH